jgi:hypothetical protein
VTARAARRHRGALLVAVLAAVAVLLPAGAASAHTSLVSSAPAAGEVLAAAPSELVLVFDDPLLPVGAQALVTGPDGAAVALGEAVVDGTTATWPLAAPTAGGEHAVTWRVTAGDGHPVEGELTFTAPAPASVVAPAPEPPAEVPAPGAPSSDAPPAPEDPGTVEGPSATGAGAGGAGPGSGAGAAAWVVVVLGAVGAAVTVVARRRRA